MAAMLTKESQGGEDGGVIETIATEILQGLSNIFLASSGSSSDSDDTDKKAAEVSVFPFSSSGSLCQFKLHKEARRTADARPYSIK